MKENLILGAGLSGLACSYHLGHANCLLIEKSEKAFGHISSELKNGYTWDQGPHVSFTKNKYVMDLFADGVEGKYLEHEVVIRNYFHGNWIDHPAQSFYSQIPSDIRKKCLDSFLYARKSDNTFELPPKDYFEWLEKAYGKVFARHFPIPYTKKYWTCNPEQLTTDWIGGRIHYPSLEDVIKGYNGVGPKNTHYITKVRYPTLGGFQSFASKMLNGANIQYLEEVIEIDLLQKKVMTARGNTYEYARLINTLPLPIFINLCRNLPIDVKEAVESLCCTQLTLVNIEVPHPSLRDENWIYIYDEDKISTRINRTESLSPNNAPSYSTGIQVEVYSSKYRPIPMSQAKLAKRVIDEITEIGLVDFEKRHIHAKLKGNIKNCEWANIIFDHDTKPALDIIWGWLEGFGLQRENDDLLPLRNWDQRDLLSYKESSLIMAGRYGQWKYFWTDDCILRAKSISDSIMNDE